METFRHRSELDHPAEEVFRWHLRPGAFERLSPPWESVRVIERSGEISDGGTITVQIRRGGVPFRWRLRHSGFEENRLIRDEQLSGPFSKWVHEHRFEDLGGGRSAIEDHVEWEPPLRGAGAAFGARIVRRELERLFRFRHARLANDLRRHARFPRAPLTVAVTGASGFIGSSFGPFLTTGGHRVVRLVRGRAAEDRSEIAWNPARGELDRDGLEAIDGVVHLAGESISGLRWTSEKKRAIRESRERSTLLLARGLSALARPPAVLVSASGVNYYGDRGDEILTEESGSGSGFLAEVCRRWERATLPAQDAGIRTVRLRTAMVVSPSGGALGTMLLPFRIGVGGRIGSGRQYMSWIDLDDHVALIHHALMDAGLEGPVNAAAPHPVPNSTFTSILGRVLGRPTVMPLPALAVRALLGEMGEELLLSGRRAVPRRAEQSGFEFWNEALENSLRFQLGRQES